MHRFDIIVAEHRLIIDTSSDSLKEWISLKFAAKTVRKTLLKNPVDLFITVEEGYGSLFESYDVKILVNEKYIHYKRDDFLVQATRDFSEIFIKVYNEFALNHALMTVYSAFITHRQWGLMTHSSCIVEHNRAYLFSGQSGAGKSTTAMLSAPRLILSDEAALVKVSKGQIQVYNSPFRSDSVWKAEEMASSFELKGCHILRQSAQIKRMPLHQMQALIHLMNTIFYWAYLPEETAKVVAMSRELVNTVPYYELYFQKNDLFWGEINEQRYEQYL